MVCVFLVHVAEKQIQSTRREASQTGMLLLEERVLTRDGDGCQLSCPEAE